MRLLRSGAVKLFKLLVRNLDLLALLCLVAAVCNFALAFSDQPVTREGLNTLDESWEVDLVFKASQGLWSGRDFAFTYGPLWQYLASLLPRAEGPTTGGVFKLLYLFSYWTSYVLAFLTLRLLLKNCAAWRRAILLVTLVAFWLSPNVRSVYPLLCFAIFYRAAAHPTSRAALALSGFLSAALISGGFLLAMDAGVMTAAALAAVLIARLLLEPAARAQAAWFAGTTLAGTMAGVLAINTWAAGPLNFQFWTWSWQVTSAYRWLMAHGLAPESAERVAWTLLACAAVFLLAWRLREEGSETCTMQPVFLLAAALFSCMVLQRGLVRSGWGHLSQCLFAAVAFSGMILVGFCNSRRRWIANAGILAAVGISVAFSGPMSLFSASGIKARLSWKAPPHPYCPPGTYHSDEACFLSREYRQLAVPAQYLAQRSAPDAPILVYPYENMYGSLARRRVSAGVLQNYVIGGDYLTALQLSKWEEDRPRYGLYCSDQLISWPVDGISNFQRTASVWLYLQRHYAAEAEPAPGVTILQRDDSRPAKISTIERQLWRAAADSAEAKIDPARWRSASTDFLRVTVEVNYPAYWKVAKPSPVFVTVSYAGGGTKTMRVAVEPDRRSELWIYPWQEENLRRYFLADASQWPAAGAGPDVIAVRLHAERPDQISVMPRSIRMESIDGVQLTMGERGANRLTAKPALTGER